MGAVLMLTRHELRGRWRSLVVVTVLVALAGAITLAAVAGARRTSSSFDRFLASARSQDVLILAFGSGVDPDDVTRIRNLPGVEALGVGRILAITGLDGELLGGGAIVAPLDDVLGRDVYRVRIIAGRAPADGVAHEIAISETLARASGLEVGDGLPVGSYTPEQMEQLRSGFDPGEPAGPEVELRVVGTTRSPDDLNVQSSDGGVLLVPAAFQAEYGDDIGNWTIVLGARLDRGDAGIADFVAQVNTILEPGTFEVDPVALTRGGVQESIDLLAMAALLVGVIAGVAGLVAVALTINGQVLQVAAAQAPLRDLGLTPRLRAVALATPVLVAVVVGAVLAMLAAWGASSLFPFGVGREAEPNPGRAFDAVTLALGAAGIVVLTGGIVAVAAWRAVAATPAGTTGMPRRSGVARLLDNLDLGPSARIGIRAALEPGRRPTAAPVRSALAGAAVAVGGITGVAVFGAGLGHLQVTPAAQGRAWDALVSDNTTRSLDGGPPCGEAETQLLDRPNLDAVATACSTNLTIGAYSVGAVSLTPLRGSIQPTVLAGRAPRAADEVGLGTHTLDALDLDLGDHATVQSEVGPITYRIVGRVIVPRLAGPQAIADGAVFTGAGFRRVGPTDIGAGVVVRVRDGVDKEAELAGIAELPGVGDFFGGAVYPTSAPLEVERLEQIDRIPEILAVLLAVLGALAVGHLLVTSGRRRRKELAVLKALGFSPRQLMSTVGWQAVSVAAFGIVVGVPLGVVGGSALWRTTADNVGVVSHVAVPVGLLVAVGVATVAVATLIAVIPARRAADVPAATLLHGE